MILYPIAILAVLFALGMPVSFAMIISVIPYFVLDPNASAQMVVQKLMSGTESFSLAAIPFFIVAGSIMNYSGITERLMRLADALVGHLTGGLGHVNVLLSTLMGGIRDVEQMNRVEGVQVYYRGIDPTPIRDFAMVGMNVPTRLSSGREAAICLPGDVVYGCSGGVLFIPPHLVQDVVDGGAKTQVKDMFGFKKITENRFTTAQIDKNTWTEEMLDLLMDFIKTEPEAEPYRALDWSKEYDLARNGDPTDTQSAL